MRIEHRVVSNEEWMNYVNSSDISTFFHTPLWAEIWEEYKGLSYACERFILDDNFQVLIPYSYYRMNEQTFHWFTYKGYGGFIIDTTIPDCYLRDFTDFFIKRYPFMRFRSNPLAPDQCKYFLWSKLDYTQMIDLEKTNTDFTVNWSKGHKKSLKKALDIGFKIKIADQIEEWQTFYNVYMDTVKRWQCPKTIYLPKFFEILFSKRFHNIKLWVVYLNNIMIAGQVCFYHNKHVHFWLSAILSQYRSYCASHLLHFYIIKNAKKNKFRWCDLGLSGKSNGIKQFKREFGTLIYPAHIYLTNPQMIQLLKENKEL